MPPTRSSELIVITPAPLTSTPVRLTVAKPCEACRSGEYVPAGILDSILPLSSVHSRADLFDQHRARRLDVTPGRTPPMHRERYRQGLCVGERREQNDGRHKHGLRE
jgi:hypothetical protein